MWPAREPYDLPVLSTLRIYGADNTFNGLVILPTVWVSDTHAHDKEGKNVKDEVQEASKQLRGDPVVRAIDLSFITVWAIAVWRDDENSPDQPPRSKTVEEKQTIAPANEI